MKITKYKNARKKNERKKTNIHCDVTNQNFYGTFRPRYVRLSNKEISQFIMAPVTSVRTEIRTENGLSRTIGSVVRCSPCEWQVEGTNPAIG